MRVAGGTFYKKEIVRGTKIALKCPITAHHKPIKFPILSNNDAIVTF